MEDKEEKPKPKTATYQISEIPKTVVMWTALYVECLTYYNHPNVDKDISRAQR